MTSMEEFTVEDMDDWNHNMIGGGDDIEIFDISKSDQSGGSNQSNSVDSESVDPKQKRQMNQKVKMIIKEMVKIDFR